MVALVGVAQPAVALGLGDLLGNAVLGPGCFGPRAVVIGQGYWVLAGVVLADLRLLVVLAGLD